MQIVVRLTADEKVYWAEGLAHNSGVKTATKHLVHGDLRREHVRNLLNVERMLEHFPQYAHPLDVQ